MRLESVTLHVCDKVVILIEKVKGQDVIGDSVSLRCICQILMDVLKSFGSFRCGKLALVAAFLQ